VNGRYSRPNIKKIDLKLENIIYNTPLHISLKLKMEFYQYNSYFNPLFLTEEDAKNMEEIDEEIEKYSAKYDEFDRWLHAELNKEMITIANRLANLHFEYKDPYNQQYTICIKDTKGYHINYIISTMEVYGSIGFYYTEKHKIKADNDACVECIGLVITFDNLFDNGWADVLINAFITKTPVFYVIDPDHNYDITEITPDNTHKILYIEPCV